MRQPARPGLDGWPPGARSAPGKIWGYPFVKHKDFLWKSKETAPPAREARRGKFRVPHLQNTRISFGNQRKTAPGARSAPAKKWGCGRSGPNGTIIISINLIITEFHYGFEILDCNSNNLIDFSVIVIELRIITDSGIPDRLQ